MKVNTTLTPKSTFTYKELEAIAEWFHDAQKDQEEPHPDYDMYASIEAKAEQAMQRLWELKMYAN